MARLNGVDVADIHGVNLLKRPVFRLDHEEKDHQDQYGTAPCKYQAVEIVNLVCDEAGTIICIVSCGMPNRIVRLQGLQKRYHTRTAPLVNQIMKRR